MNPLMPMILLVATARNRSQKRLAENLLPALLPAPASHRLLIATVTSDKQEKEVIRLEDNLVAETVQILNGKNVRLTETELDGLPIFKASLDRRPDLKAKVVLAASSQTPARESSAAAGGS